MRGLGLASVFTASLVAAQFLASEKIVWLFVPFLVAPAGFLPYAVTFLVTDIAARVYGRDFAMKLVWWGFLVNLLLLGYIAVAHAMPSVRGQVSLTPLSIILASIIAYLVSQTHDVWAFHSLWQRLHTTLYARLKRAELSDDIAVIVAHSLSTAASQLIDTTIFITLAFYALPQLGIPGPLLPLTTVGQMVLTQWLLKAIVAVLDIPACYIAVSKLRRAAWE